MIFPMPKSHGYVDAFKSSSRIHLRERLHSIPVDLRWNETLSDELGLMHSLENLNALGWYNFKYVAVYGPDLKLLFEFSMVEW